jgi:hypothetical protein
MILIMAFLYGIELVDPWWCRRGRGCSEATWSSRTWYALKRDMGALITPLRIGFTLARLLRIVGCHLSQPDTEGFVRLGAVVVADVILFWVFRM